MLEIVTSLDALCGNCRTWRGGITHQTALAIVAGTGEHSGDATTRSNDAGLTNGAASFGVLFEFFKDWQDRVKRARHDLNPDEASERGQYVYDKRNKRSVCTHPEGLDLAKRFWHNEEIPARRGIQMNFKKLISYSVVSRCYLISRCVDLYEGLSHAVCCLFELLSILSRRVEHLNCLPYAVLPMSAALGVNLFAQQSCCAGERKHFH